MAGDGMETKQSIPKFLASLVLNPAFSSAQSIDLEPKKGRPSASGNATVVFHALPI
jgi:hypothetical protein